MGGIVYTIIIGAVIGVLARFIKPGADPTAGSRRS